MPEVIAPTVDEIRTLREQIDPYVVETPVWRWSSPELTRALDDKPGQETDVFLKLELFQRTGTFKPRGALSNMMDLDRDALARGVTAVSAGNHAIAVSYAASILGASAKVVMMESASPVRVQLCRSYGADVELMPDVHQAFARVEQIEEEEGRRFIHPFEGPLTARGTATVGLEWCRQAPEMDAVIVPIGGGGLCAGISCAVKQMMPDCTVYGVEPMGADTMHRSFVSGQPESIDQVQTIADSLGAPFTMPYSFGLCRQFVDELVKIDDEQMKSAMRLLFYSMKLAVEPAGAAATAALCGPLKERLRGKRVGVIVCGTTIDVASFTTLVTET
jgi:threonine dehydratase